MEFKIKANVVFSKVLVIEAENLGEVMQIENEQMQKSINLKEFESSKMTYELLEPAVK